MLGNEEIQRRFDFHPADDQKAYVHETVRGILGDAAWDFDRILPDGREKSLAITKLEEAMFWANAAIAREGK